MTPHDPLRSLPRPAATDGFTIVEVLIAALVLGAGILGMIGAFDSGRKLTQLSERRTAMAHRAQLEIERLQTYGYEQLTMTSAPAHSSETTNPDYYATTTYQYAENEPEKSETFVLGPSNLCKSTTETACSAVSGEPSSWVDGQVSGKVYDFITWHNDGSCGAECKATENYKRLTVVVTAKVPAGNHEPKVMRLSTFVAEPPPES